MVAGVPASFRNRLVLLSLLGFVVRAVWVAVEPATDEALTEPPLYSEYDFPAHEPVYTIDEYEFWRSLAYHVYAVVHAPTLPALSRARTRNL